MGDYSYLDKFSDQIRLCTRCGLCRAVCPVFAVEGTESQVSRGKIALMEGVVNGDLTLSEAFVQNMGVCINCKACIQNCPSGVAFDDLILSTRAELAGAGHLPFLKRFIFRQLLKRGRLVPPVARWVSFFQRVILRGLKENSPYRLLLPLANVDSDRILPVFAKTSYLAEAPEVAEVPGHRMRVGYFVGCSGNLIYPQIPRSVVNLLTLNGVEVIIPPEQVCCGTPVFNAGDFETAKDLARQNLDVFNHLEVEAIITACGSCGLALRREYPVLLGVGEFDVPVYDVSEFLIHVLNFDKTLARGDEIRDYDREMKVTYHDPCHLNRGMGVNRTPRLLLKALFGENFVEMEGAEECCSGGGTFSLSHYRIAKGIGEKKLQNIQRSGCDILATGCPNCIMRLREIVEQADLAVQVVHFIELLSEVDLYREEKEKTNFVEKKTGGSNGRDEKNFSPSVRHRRGGAEGRG